VSSIVRARAPGIGRSSPDSKRILKQPGGQSLRDSKDPSEGSGGTEAEVVEGRRDLQKEAEASGASIGGGTREGGSLHSPEHVPDRGQADLR